jgi:GTP-binding protein
MGDHAAHGRLGLSLAPMPASPEEAPDAEAIEAGRLLFAQPCHFVTGIARLDQVPEARLPEVAFAGRSNVGKSSLINALTGRHQLARISNTPGRTQQINLFDLGGRLGLADLPGYGYAKAPRPLVDAWNRLLRAYLRGRSTLRLACVLVDARHGLKDSDREFMTMLAEAALAFRIVLTKVDLVRPAELDDLVAAVAGELQRTQGAHPTPLPTSARTGHGIDRLRAALAALAPAEDA